ncbi:hypothetical protein ACFWBG_06770 [Nocardia salmonicida]|uniref:hypothetical protein n=1 Tax=Nocardia salmonicida TaxID=53431 RepID=UPI00366C173D
MRIDFEILGQSILEHQKTSVLNSSSAAEKHGPPFESIDAATFGVHGTINWGPAEIRGNAIKDLAALNKVETLPWDEWGRMTASYNGETGADYHSLLDTIAVTAAGDDLHAGEHVDDANVVR